MTRSVRAVALHRPVWESDGRRLAGPDEDEFTLAVAALESLGSGTDTPAIGRLTTLGPSWTPSGAGFREALGIEGLEVGAADERASLEDALSGAISDAASSSTLEAVVVVDAGSAGEEASGAMAWLLGEGPGLRLEPGRGAANGPVTLGRRAATVGPVDARDPRSDRIASAGSEGTAATHPLAGSIALARRARRLSPDQGASWTGNGVRGHWKMDLSGPVRWLGPWDSPGRSLPISPERARKFREPVRLDRVSEGAYLPRPRYLESLPSRWRLIAERCGRCGARTFPPRGRCRGCGSREDLRAEPLPLEDGEVEAVTTVRAGAQPTEFDPQVEQFGDYDVAIVRLASDVRATFQVTDSPPGGLRVGDRVRTALRRLYPQEGEWRYGRKAVPKESRAAPTLPS